MPTCSWAGRVSVHESACDVAGCEVVFEVCRPRQHDAHGHQNGRSRKVHDAVRRLVVSEVLGDGPGLHLLGNVLPHVDESRAHPAISQAPGRLLRRLLESAAVSTTLDLLYHRVHLVLIESRALTATLNLIILDGAHLHGARAVIPTAPRNGTHPSTADGVVRLDRREEMWEAAMVNLGCPQL